MFGAAKIIIAHIDRRIGLRYSAVGRTLIRQGYVSYGLVWLVSHLYIF